MKRGLACCCLLIATHLSNAQCIIDAPGEGSPPGCVNFGVWCQPVTIGSLSTIQCNFQGLGDMTGVYLGQIDYRVQSYGQGPLPILPLTTLHPIQVDLTSATHYLSYSTSTSGWRHIVTHAVFIYKPTGQEGFLAEASICRNLPPA
jgi:hypothetical protein